jgi:DNA-binding NarL/FixJ family response regulator
MPLRILIADDSNVVRAAIRDLLDRGPQTWVVCGEAADGEDTVIQARTLKPDLVLLDLSLRQSSGIPVARALQDFLPSTAVVIMSEQDPQVLRHIAESFGLKYYLVKSALGTDLILHLRKLADP